MLDIIEVEDAMVSGILVEGKLTQGMHYNSILI